MSADDTQPSKLTSFSDSPASLSQLTNSLNHVSITENGLQSNKKIGTPPQPMIVYSRPQLLALYNSPLVKPPPDMPELKVWFGIENEQNLTKKDPDPVTPNSARDRRFRRDVEDSDTTSRPSFRSTVSQPSQMGNFKHQSLRSTDRDRDRDIDKDRERDIRDREGQERLRHLSDKYDRDRLALPSNLRNKDRDTAPHLTNPSSSRTGSQNQVSGSAVRRVEGREGSKKKAVEASDDWRRGIDLSRPSRDDRSDNTRREERDRARSRARDSSKARRDPSSRRERERDRDDRDKLPRDRDRDDHRRDRDEYRRDRERDTERDPEQEDSRRWRDDGKRDERIAARRTTERTKDRTDPWDASSDRRWSPADDRDGRYRRSARDRKPGAHDEPKDDRKEREKEKEPAWMETYIPIGSGSGILDGKDGAGGLDGIQAWKKELKEKEQKEKTSLKPESEVTGTATAAAHVSQSEIQPLDEIQIFKMIMKREEEKKKSNHSSPEPSAKPSSMADMPAETPRAVLKYTSDGITAEEVNGNRPVSTQNIDNSTSRISPGPQALLSILGSKPPSSSLTVSPVISEHPDDRSKTPSSRLFPNLIPQDKAIQMAGPPGLDTSVNQFNPPPGSRLLALGRSGMKSPGAVNTSSSPIPTDGSLSKGDISRTVPFSPFDPQFGKDEHELHRRPSAASFTALSGPGIEPSQDNGLNYSTGKGSRFAKFFDGKQREVPLPGSKAHVPIGLVSSSPNPQLAQEQRNFTNAAIVGGEQKTMDEIFAMLNNSTAQGHRPNLAHAGAVPIGASIPFTSSLQNGAPILHQQAHPQQQIHPSSRLESLYDNRMDDRNFVPDGMVPGLRPAPPPRARENPNIFPDDESSHFNGQRIPHNHQQRAMDVLYSGPSPPMFNQPPHRGSGLPLQQGHYRGGPSPISNPHNALAGVAQQRLPPGLANLGGRPPHDPTQFINVPAMSTGTGMLQSNMSVAGGPPLQQFNNFDGPQNLNFGAHQMRGPIPLHQLQSAAGHHIMGGIGHHGNVDLRMPTHGQLSGIAGRGLNPGFGGQQNIGGQQLSLGMRQQPHLPSHVMPHMMTPHLQQQQQQIPPGPLNPAHDLMALLLGGPQRE